MGHSVVCVCSICYIKFLAEQIMPKVAYEPDYTDEQLVEHITKWLADPEKYGKTILTPAQSHAHIPVLWSAIKRTIPQEQWHRIQVVAPGDVIT